MSRLEKFLPTELEKLLFPCVVALLAAAIFVALGFLAAYWSIRWLQIIAWLLTFVSVIVGGACIVSAALQTIFGPFKSDATEK